jgi:tetratricopeptide (TPR) repeat protein
MANGRPRSPKKRTARSNAMLATFPDWLAAALLFTTVLVAYWPALQGRILWDDDRHVTKPALQTLHGLWRIWFDLGATQQYYPLLHSAFWVEHRLWGDAVVGYHLTNIALHTTAACLVVLVVRRLALPGAWLAGLVFAMHPVFVEAVAWISEQKTTLSAVFYLAAALAYLTFDTNRQKSKYWLALVLFVAALLTKTVTATLPAALLVILWWKRGRLDWKRDVLPLLPWFAVGIPAGLFTAWVEKVYVGANGPEFALSMTQRFLLAGRVIVFYTWKLLWPVNLIFSYPHWTVDSASWWQYLYPAGVLGAAIIFTLLVRHHRGPLAGFLFFIGTLFPVLGFLDVLPFRYSFVADHFQYLASLGVIVPLTSAIWQWVATLRSGAGAEQRSHYGGLAVSVLLVVGLGVMSWQQSGIYTDDETLYRAILTRNSSSWLAHTNLGSILLQRPGGTGEAMKELQAAVELNPNSAEARDDLGTALSQSGREDDAIAEYRAALRINPKYLLAYDNLGNVFARMPNHLPDAIALYQQALRINPDYVEAHNNLGVAWSKTPGRSLDAISEYRAALRIEPDVAETHFNLGKLLSNIPGRKEEALAEFSAAVRIRPDLQALAQQEISAMAAR